MPTFKKIWPHGLQFKFPLVIFLFLIVFQLCMRVFCWLSASSYLLVIFQISKQYIQLSSYYKIQVFLTPMSLILKYKTHCVPLPTVLYLANPALKSILRIFLSIWLGNFLTAFGEYCGSTLGVAKLRTASLVFASLGSDQKYSSGLEVVRNFWNFCGQEFVSQEGC